MEPALSWKLLVQLAHHSGSPAMWVVDVVLLSLTVLHLVFSVSFVTPVDSPLKKPLVKVTYEAIWE